MHPIDPQEVSVVLQGPVTEWTRRAVASAHQHLPGAQVVLSTWTGSDLSPLEGLEVDVVESDDPGGGPQDLAPDGSLRPPMNTHRMFTSSRAGLVRAERPHVLRTRADAILTGTGALGWSEAAARAPRSLFHRRLLTCSIATRPAQSGLLYHLSDCFHFGLREDVVDLWSGRLLSDGENHGFWARHGRASPWMWDARYANEQQLWIGFLTSRGVAVDHPHLGAPATPAEVERSTRSVVDNFVVLEPWQLGVSFPKLEPVVRASGRGGYLSFEDWLREEHRTRAD